MNPCDECGKESENEFRACKGACSQELSNGGDLMDTKGLISCNCCEDCRWECHESFMNQIDEEE